MYFLMGPEKLSRFRSGLPGYGDVPKVYVDVPKGLVLARQVYSRFPADQFTTWCAAMELNDEEQLKFLHIAVIAQGPPALQAYIARLESQINKLKK